MTTPQRRHTRQLQISLSPHYTERLDTLCEAQGVTRSELIRRWIDRTHEETRPMKTTAYLIPCNRDEIPVTSLQQEMDQNPAAPFETYRVKSEQFAEVGSLIFADTRAGIAVGGDAEWTDAISAEDALRRWLCGEMTN